MRPQSLRGRLLLATTLLTALALVLAWVLLSSLLSDFVQRRLERELTVSVRAVMAASEWNETGAFLVDPAPADPRFERPLSGWYWQVNDRERALARSASLVTGELASDSNRGPDGTDLLSQQARFTAPGDGRTLTVRVALPAAEAEAEVEAILQPLLWALAALAVLLIGAQGLAIRVGLRDLNRFATAVAARHHDDSQPIPEPDASELQPLARELERLLQANADQMERARAHAGDLAHALKTPLAILANRADPEVIALVERMDRSVRWHLQRARSDAVGQERAALPCPVAPVLDDVLLVITPEAERRGVRIDCTGMEIPPLAGSAEDLTEILGVLVENAVQWATSRVVIDLTGQEDRVAITIDDDGPGIPQPDRQRLMVRGARLDEQTPGTGLGLAIAADRCRACGGTLTLEDSPLGGLRVRILLPAVV